MPSHFLAKAWLRIKYVDNKPGDMTVVQFHGMADRFLVPNEVYFDILKVGPLD